MRRLAMWGAVVGVLLAGGALAQSTDDDRSFVESGAPQRQAVVQMLAPAALVETHTTTPATCVDDAAKAMLERGAFQVFIRSAQGGAYLVPVISVHQADTTVDKDATKPLCQAASALTVVRFPPEVFNSPQHKVSQAYVTLLYMSDWAQMKARGLAGMYPSDTSMDPLGALSRPSTPVATPTAASSAAH